MYSCILSSVNTSSILSKLSARFIDLISSSFAQYTFPSIEDFNVPEYLFVLKSKTIYRLFLFTSHHFMPQILGFCMSSPVSSLTSLITESTIDSLFSICPPGKVIPPPLFIYLFLHNNISIIVIYHTHICEFYFFIITHHLIP